MSRDLREILTPDECRFLQRRGVLGSLGDSLPPNPNGEPGPFEVTEAEAAFLDDAKARVAAMRAMAERIGPPGWFDIGPGYGEKWGPVLDRLADLLADARRNLEVGSPQMAAFNAGATGLNNAIFRIRSQSASAQLYEAVLAAFSGNPIALMNYVVRQASSAGRLTVDTGRAAVDVYGGWLGDFWRWLPGWARVAIPVAVVGGVAIVVRQVKKTALG